MTHPSMFTFKAFGTFLVCSSMIALPACAETSRPSAIRGTGATSTLPLKSAAPRKSNGSGIEVRFRIDGTARRGEPLTVTLGFVGVAAQAGASVRLEADSGLALPEPYRSAMPLSDSDSGSPIVVPVTPTADGLSYLHVFTTQYGITSVSSIPLQTGVPIQKKPSNDLQATPDGDLLKAIPVR